MYQLQNPFTGEWQNYYCANGDVRTKTAVVVTYAYWGAYFYLGLPWDLEDTSDNDCNDCNGGTWRGPGHYQLLGGTVAKTEGFHLVYQGEWFWNVQTVASHVLPYKKILYW